jgi:hypothetical protein
LSPPQSITAWRDHGVRSCNDTFYVPRPIKIVPDIDPGKAALLLESESRAEHRLKGCPKQAGLPILMPNINMNKESHKFAPAMLDVIRDELIISLDMYIQIMYN